MIRPTRTGQHAHIALGTLAAEAFEQLVAIRRLYPRGEVMVLPTFGGLRGRGYQAIIVDGEWEIIGREGVTTVEALRLLRERDLLEMRMQVDLRRARVQVDRFAPASCA